MKFRKCPSKAELLRAFADSGEAAERALILEHAGACSGCRTVIEAMREIESGEDEILLGLDRIQISGEARKRLKKRAAGEIRRLKPRRAHRRIWTPAAGAALALLATVGVLRFGGSLRRDVERTAGPVRIELLKPQGVLSAGAPEFAWTRTEGASDFSLVVYSRDLRPVLALDAGAADRISLPGSAVSTLAAGATYFWKITATLGDGQTIESDFAGFVLQR